MSEPFLERLSRFTPDAGGLDRDALLFAAGRNSVRPNRGWKTVASLLAATQALSLVLLWPRPNPPTSPSTMSVATVTAYRGGHSSTRLRGVSEPPLWVIGTPQPAGVGPRNPARRRRHLHRSRAALAGLGSAARVAPELSPRRQSVFLHPDQEYSMLRTVLCCAALAFVALPCRADEPAANPETLIRLTVHPAAAPKPALRYQLLPELKEMNPGNPHPELLEVLHGTAEILFRQGGFQRREKLLAMPLKELPARELQEYGGFALSQADWAARLDNPDWQILLNMKADGIYLLIPDVQAAPTPGHGAQGALASRGRPGPLRRRSPNRQNDVRHVAPPGRAPDVRWQPVWVCHREPCHRPPGGDAGAAGLPQPLLGADEPARPSGPPGLRRVEGERVGIIQWVFRDLDDSAPMSADQLKRLIAYHGQAART